MRVVEHASSGVVLFTIVIATLARGEVCKQGMTAVLFAPITMVTNGNDDGEHEGESETQTWVG